ncbi:MFS transporter [Bradyrhizobium elkanii]|uniref:MFS transporter n=1 Tax=Bradyrhizobium elkanii TaxID=29448 RepID=UPI00272C4132|nr:MFS transporter [Bradyrhizobium elkanii]WLA85010.1 MFS transporter [Bradyrhizobium elkanii]
MSRPRCSAAPRGLPRSYLALLVGQTISLLGSNVTLLALPLTAITLLDAGPAQTGLLLACGRAPYLVVSLFAGVVVDRLPHRRILLTANLVMAATLATIPLFANLGHLGLVQLYTTSMLVGVAAVIADVAYLACIPTLLDRSQLVRAQSSLELSQAGAMAAGPFLAGWLVNEFSAPTAILADSISFLLAAALLSLVPLRNAGCSEAAPRAVLGQVAEGLVSLFGNPVLRAVTLASGTFIFWHNAYSAAFLLHLTKDLGFDSRLVGMALGIGALGGVVGAASSPRVGRAIGLGPTLMIGLAVSAGGMSLAALLTQPWWAAVAFVTLSQFMLWIGQGIYNVQQVPIRYALAPPHLQGRINASIRSVVWGLASLGALAGGAVAAATSLRTTLLASSVLGMASIVWIWPLRQARSLRL